MNILASLGFSFPSLREGWPSPEAEVGVCILSPSLREGWARLEAEVGEGLL